MHDKFSWLATPVIRTVTTPAYGRVVIEGSDGNRYSADLTSFRSVSCYRPDAEAWSRVSDVGVNRMKNRQRETGNTKPVSGSRRHFRCAASVPYAPETSFIHIVRGGARIGEALGR